MVAFSVAVVSVSTEDPQAAQVGSEPGAAAPDLGGLGEILDRFTAAVDDLVGFDPTVLSDPAVEAGIQRVVEQARRLPAARGALVLEAVRRGLPGTHRHRSAGTYLRELVRCTAGDGNRWARHADALAPRVPVSGGKPLPPELPETAAAVGDGAIGDRHVALIVGTIARFPASVDPEERARWEGLLARQARVLDPDALDQVCKQVLAGVDPDGTFDERETQRRRGFTIGRQGLDGMTPVRGTLTPEAAAMVRSALDPLAAPRSTDGCPDTRLATQRYHDALQELARRALAHGGLPSRHGHHATMLVTIRLDDLEHRTGLATVAHGGHVPVRDLLRHAADTTVIPVVLDTDGVVLHYGEETRLAEEHQRRALITMDIGCTWPGCDTPGVFSEGAHTEPFRLCKKTGIDGLALMCPYHHHHADNNGYLIERIKGRIWITPPRWIDPQQTPRTNEYFKPLRN